MMPTRLPDLRERDGDVHGDGRLPTPPLPAPTAITFFTPGTGWRSAFGQRGGAHGGRHLDVDGRHAWHRGDQRLRLRLQAILHRTRRRRQLDRERHGARGIDREALHEAEADDVLSEVGIDDAAKRIEHGGLV